MIPTTYCHFKWPLCRYLLIVCSVLTQCPCLCCSLLFQCLFPQHASCSILPVLWVQFLKLSTKKYLLVHKWNNLPLPLSPLCVLMIPLLQYLIHSGRWGKTGAHKTRKKKKNTNPQQFKVGCGRSMEHQGYIRHLLQPSYFIGKGLKNWWEKCTYELTETTVFDLRLFNQYY